MQIRKAANEDIPALLSMEQSGKGYYRQQIHKWVSEGHTVVAVVGDQIAGYAVLEYTFFGLGFISMLFVQKQNRHKGLAASLVTHLEKHCRTEKLFTSTNTSNKPMQALLEKMSWEPSGTVYNLDEGDPELFFVKRLRKEKRDSGND
jgi:N-acetylglutamate synthase-like GNAT family acetyltransferase